MANIEQDRAEILRLHNTWMEANKKGSIPMMREAFVGGDNFHGFNLNGFTYEGIEEWVTLWKFLIGAEARAKVGNDENLKIEIRGDTAWLTCTADFTLLAADGTPAPGSGKFRSTEVYLREDEHGASTWKMWHFHCSWHAPTGEPRMGFQS